MEAKQKQREMNVNKNEKDKKRKVKSILKPKFKYISKLVLGSVLPIVMISIIVGTIYEAFYNKRNDINNANIPPEIAVAMEYPQVEEGEEEIEISKEKYPNEEYNNDIYPYVQFDAFFLRDLNSDGYAEKIRGTCREIGQQDTLYIQLNVLTNGYLKEGATITLNGDRNFYFQTSIVKDNEIAENYVSTDTQVIKLNRIEAGKQKLLEGTIKENIGLNIGSYSKINSITFKGTHVETGSQGEDVKEIELEKTVQFKIDWHGKVQTKITNVTQTKYVEEIEDIEAQTIKIYFGVEIQEIKEQLNLSQLYIEGTIPEFNGYKPTKVYVEGTNVEYRYNEETMQLIAYTQAELNDVTKDITRSIARKNNYIIRLEYPMEAYRTLGKETFELKIPVKAYYEGYNNENYEFENPYKSNIATDIIILSYEKRLGKIAEFEITVGEYINNPVWDNAVLKRKPLNIYNGKSETEINDTYVVTWYARMGSEGKTTGIIMKETKTDSENTKVSDKFVKADNTEDSLEDITKNIGIYFEKVSTVLGKDGWIKVYDDETDNLVEEFNSSNWSNYTKTNPYIYKTPIRHIRIETSETNSQSSLEVYNIKELDDNAIINKYELEEFLNIKYIKSTVSGYVNQDANYINTDTYNAKYIEDTSIARVSIKENTLSTQEINKDNQLIIETIYFKNSNMEKWQNGSFLLKLPKEIVDVKIKDVVINQGLTKVVDYEKYVQAEVENGEEQEYIFIKIITENDIEENYRISINCDITVDSRITTKTGQIELYATNENGTTYLNNIEDKYDVNNNLNNQEKVNYSATNVSLISPNSLLISQIASDFDETNKEIVAPKIAEISKKSKTATITTQITNNYSRTVSNIAILGKIPYAGNTYVINGSDMGSNFNTTMVDTGITVPEQLKNVAKVYYSEIEDVTTDLEDAGNEWKEEGKVDFANVKSFLIILEDYELKNAESHKFSYKINIPGGIDYNKVSYSHIAVYFNLDTENGKYETQTEPTKLGFMIAGKYNVELTKYQKGSQSKVVSGATYSIMDETENIGELVENNISKTTDTEGKLTLENLYVGRTYTIKEIKSPQTYELNQNEIKFKTSEVGGILVLDKLEGTTDESVRKLEMEELQGEDYKLVVELEDEVKPNLCIKKVDQNTYDAIKGIKFKIQGKGFGETGKFVTTDSKGEVNLNGLYINEEYTIEEVKADGYYLAGNIKFLITHEDNYDIRIIDITEQMIYLLGAFEVTTENEIPTVNLAIQNESIPIYNLTINKIEKGKPDILLSGAKFKLTKDGKEIGRYETGKIAGTEQDGEPGKVTIQNLYAYEESKKIEQTYKLEEIVAPVGYSKVKDIEFKVTKGEDGNFSLETMQDLNYQVNKNNITITIEDSPSFKLTKQVAEGEENAGDLLPNTKFVIYNIDEGTVPARNSKGELIGEREIINGKEYNVLTTDNKGEITADLPQGLYKAVEVKASEDKYTLAKEKYFGIGASEQAKGEIITELAEVIGGDYSIESILETSDGGYWVTGNFTSLSVNLGKGINGNNVIIENMDQPTTDKSKDGMIVKYRKDGKVEWAKVIGTTGSDQIKLTSKTKDGGYLVVARFSSQGANLGKGTDGEDVIINGNEDVIIKYTNEGVVEWTKTIGITITSLIETSDEGYLVGGMDAGFRNNLGEGIDGNDVIINPNTYDDGYTWRPYSDGIIIKFRKDKKIEWVKQLVGDNSNDIISITETINEKYIINGYSRCRIMSAGDDVVIENVDEDAFTEFAIEFDDKGKMIWAKAFGFMGGSDVVGTNDGGFILAGYVLDEIILGKGVDGNDVIVDTNEDGENCLIIVKYTEEGLVEWKKEISGNIIYTMVSTSDGGLIAGIHSENNSINLGEGTDGKDVIVKNNGLDNTLIFKYNSNGKVEWVKVTEGYNIYSISETKDKEVLVGGSFGRVSINLGKGTDGEDVILSRLYNGNNEIIIKYNYIEAPKTRIEYAKKMEGDCKIVSMVETSDGGYIVGGYYESDSINLGEDIDGNEVIINKESGYYDEDGLIIKYNIKGQIEWVKTIEGEEADFITSVSETRDGGYIISGYSYTDNINLGEGIDGTDVILTKDYNYYDGIIIKYREDGKVEWAKNIGGEDYDCITSVIPTNDKGYIIGGYFTSYSIDLGEEIIYGSGSYNGSDALLIKYKEDGKVEWAKVLQGSKITSIAKTNDGGYIVGGNLYSNTLNLGKGIDGEDIIIENKAGPYLPDAMIIKYRADGIVEWARVVEGILNEEISTILATSDGGYIVGGDSNSSTLNLGKGIDGEDVVLNNNGNYDGLIVKYRKDGVVEWAKTIGEYDEEKITSISETNEGKYVVGGYFKSTSISLGKGADGKEITLTNNGYNKNDGMIIEYTKDGIVEWTKAIGGTNDDYVYSVLSTSNLDYIIGGNFASRKIVLDKDNNLINDNNTDNGMIIKIDVKVDVPQVKEVVVENEIKQFIITTKVKAMDGNKGGEISGEEVNPYETVKYGETAGTDNKTIVMRPYEGYDIAKVTINGERTLDYEKQGDGSYKLKPIENVQEDKHIVVTYSKTSNTLTLNKKAEDGETPLAGAKFRIEKMDEREVPQGVIKNIVDNGQPYYYADKQEEKQISGVLGKIEANGEYSEAIISNNEVTGIIKEDEMIDDASYYFVKTTAEDGSTYYEPTNSKTYQEAHGGSGDQKNTTAHSCFEINLTDYEGNVGVVINARVSSESSDKGYATITKDKTMPKYNSSETYHFMCISNKQNDANYTSQLLEGGNIYYLHLGYKKDSSIDKYEDRVIINSIKLYEATGKKYCFEEKGESYVSNNKDYLQTVANSYIPINLSEIPETQKVALVVNAQISSSSANYGYATITNDKTAPSYNNSNGRFIYISGEKQSDDYETILQGGRTYYLHLGYRNQYKAYGEQNVFTINSIKVYQTRTQEYNFETIEEVQENINPEVKKKYVSTNKGKPNTEANSYIPINLEGKTGKYNIIVNAEISSQIGDYGYVTITDNTIQRVTYSDNTTSKNRFVNISGEKEATNYTTVVEGGKEYYLHMGYYKNEKTDEGNDKFTINNIEITLNGEDLYREEVITDKFGQAFLELEPARYTITEIEAPKGYELSEPIIHALEAGKTNEETIIDKKKSKVTVHHYLKGEYEEDGSNKKIADDEIIYGTKDTEYETKPKVGLDMYELAKREDGEYDIDGNPKGLYTDEDQEITYYYTKKKVSLIVHHYIEGTMTPVLLSNGERAKDIISENEEGALYSTSAIPEIAGEDGQALDNKYELLKMPENAEGKYQYPKVEVTYYYKLVKGEVIINKYVKGEEKTPLSGAKFKVEQIDESQIQNNEKNYNVVDKTQKVKLSKELTTDEFGKVSIYLEAGKYIITEIEAPHGYKLHAEEVYQIEINNSTERVIQINVENERQTGQVIVNHYIYDKNAEEPHTNTRVPLEGGKESESQTITAIIGSMYGSEPLKNLKEGYKLYEIPKNKSGLIQEGVTEVNYYYISYAIINSEITKDGSDKILAKDEPIQYMINYTSNISNYEGNAVVTIVDTLPYALDVDKMKELATEEGINTEDSNTDWLKEFLQEGEYKEELVDESGDDAKTYTITWTQTIEKIDTLGKDETQDITIDKNIKVIFKDVDIKQTSFTNTVKGKITLEATEQTMETEPATHETKANYIKDVKVTKKWEHGENIYERPKSVIIQLKNGEKVVESYKLTEQDNWTHTFTGLPKYDEETGEEIYYTVDEQAVGDESLKYYKKK